MQKQKLKLVILNSHGDSCSFNTILENIAGNEIDAEIELIICSNEASKEYALNKTKNIGINPKIFLVDRKSFDNIDRFNDELHKILDNNNFNLVVLAGFLSLFKVGDKYKNKVINLHPALFSTKAKGKDAYGKKVYEQVLREGLPAGVTVHFADDEYDHGKIILEKEVPVLADDTPETLGKRICEQGTRIILPKAIQMIAEGKIKLG